MKPQAGLGLRERVLGSLLGGALGDAWGSAYEGRAGPVDFQIPARPKLSDDTQLTLATCNSILEQRRVDPANIADHFLQWFREGRVRGMGSSTLKAMRDLMVGTHWALAGARGEYAAGSGSAMRIAPAAFWLDPSNPGDRTVIRDVCRITHHSDEAYAGGLAVALAIRAVLSGRWPGDSFLAVAFDGLPDSAVRDRIAAMMQVRGVDTASTFGVTGHVVDTVPLALYCAGAISTEPLEAVLAAAITAGGDTDTIASITGQVAGTAVGARGVPRERLNCIGDIQEVFRIVEEFAEAAEQNFAFSAGTRASL